MSRRQLISPDDSLELLLDTICNTFGAVIFISMLASILVQNSTPPGASAQETAAAIEQTSQRQRELSELQRRQQLLDTQLTQQEELIRRFSSTESISLAIQIHDDTKSQVQMESQKSDAAEAVVEAEREQLQVQQALQAQLQKLKEITAEQADAESKLRNMQATVGHTAEIRRVHETTKFGYTFALDNGRLYAIHKSDGSATNNEFSLTLNRDDCDVLQSGGGTVIRPIADKGILLRDSATAEQDAKDALKPVSKTFVVRLFVARDSFGDFLPVKEALHSLDLEYIIEPMPGDDVELHLSEKTQDKSYAQ